MSQIATKPASIKETLLGGAFKDAVSEVLPKHVTPDRMARAAVTAITRTPKLAECDQASFFRCMMELSGWGLEPDGRHAHLIPFRNNKKGTYECQLILDYKGIVELAFRSGKVKSIHADVVYSGDLFAYNLGSVDAHVPHYLRTDDARPDKKGDIIAAFCVVTLTDGVRKCEVMSLDEIKAIKARSKSGGNGPWVTDFGEMAKKTAFKRASKWIPLSPDVRDAMTRDDDHLTIESTARPRMTASELVEQMSEPPLVEHQPAENDTWDEAIANATTKAELIELAVQLDDDDSVGELKAGLSKQINARIKEIEG